MADYREMYLHLMRETEKALRILVKAQQDCEEMYLSAPEPKLTVLVQEEPLKIHTAPPIAQPSPLWGEGGRSDEGANRKPTAPARRTLTRRRQSRRHPPPVRGRAWAMSYRRSK